MKPFNEFYNAEHWQEIRNKQREVYVSSEKAEIVCTAIVILGIAFFTFLLGVV